jgi:hypothetical protein
MLRPQRDIQPDLMTLRPSSRLPAVSFRSYERGAKGTNATETHRRSGSYLSLDRTFPMSQPLSPSDTANSFSDSNGSGPGNGHGSANGSAKPLRHVLEFERPLAQLEQQIRELEAQQSARQVDYAKELRMGDRSGSPPPSAAAVSRLRRHDLPGVPRATRRPPVR